MEINIADILLKCPKGTKLYSPIFGECTFIKVKKGVYHSYDEIIYVHVQIAASHEKTFDFAGRYGDNRLGECMLFPSKENKDWLLFEKQIPPNLILNERFKEGQKVYYPWFNSHVGEFLILDREFTRNGR